HTENYEAMKEVMKKYDPKTVEGLTGIPADQLVEAARLFAQAESASIVYSMGITQHAHGTDNVKACGNLAMIAGQIGKPSSGVNPLRGQNNVQGACDMGALPNVFPGYQAVTNPDVIAKFEKAWGKQGLPAKVGLTVTEVMSAVHDGKVKGLYIMGENPMVSDPDLNHVRQSLEHAEFLVVQDIFLTETAQMAHVVLPATSFAETDGTFTNTERRVLPVRRIMANVGQCKEDWQIIQELANAMGEKWNYASPAEIMREINQVTPSYGGITPERIANGELLQWPCPTVQHPGTPYLHKDGNFTRGKGLFAAVDHIGAKEQPDKDFPLVLNTGRLLFHYHTASMTRRTRALPEYVNEAFMEMNPLDCKKLGVKHQEKVKVSSRRGTINIAIKETERVAEGSVFIPFHFAEAAANMLTNNVIDPIAKIPELKVCAVKVERL
ncbi:MAG TPA: molybdopterin-dependent oxidoreductase, partial [Spirochaetales bacterium]|nr:molybdopterin-dependent oxidoreductase [Spirochaetales bacterium]